MLHTDVNAQSNDNLEKMSGSSLSQLIVKPQSQIRKQSANLQHSSEELLTLSKSCLHRARLFNCSYDGCGKVYKQRSKLTAHLRLHMGFKPFVCQICSKAFNYKWNLKSHIYLHDNLTPYRCYFNGCTMRYNNSGDLKIHLASHSSSRAQFYCPYCNENFSRYKTTITHIVSAHPNNHKNASKIFVIEKKHHKRFAYDGPKESSSIINHSSNENGIKLISNERSQSLNCSNLESSCEIALSQLLLEHPEIQGFLDLSNYACQDNAENLNQLKELILAIWPMIETNQPSYSYI